MCFSSKAFRQFKSNQADCYEFHVHISFPRENQDIFFETKEAGLNLRFSLDEIGELLSLLQEAELKFLWSQPVKGAPL